LGELKKEDFLVEGFDADGKAKKWGIIHQAAAAMHVGAGYKHLIQVNFKEFDQAKVPGMYELAYVYFKLYNDETDLELIVKNTIPAAGGVETVDVSTPEIPKKGPPPHCAYTDPDDDMLTGYFAQPADLNKRPELLRAPAKIGVPKITGDNRRFRLYDDAGKTINIDRPSTQDGQAKAEEYKLAYTSKAKGPFLQSRHPVCIIEPKKWQGKIGVMGDMHVSSRQSLFPLANAQVIPGADTEKDSPYIGKIANQSLKSAESLMEGIGKNCDVLALVGDLYDHTRNCDPNHFTDTVKNTGQLWDAMDFRQYEDDYNAYPREIDGLLMLERILDFYSQRQKPVIYISGNHEGYERPFGMSPRIESDTLNITFIRANAGIPADHNLTIYEAALLYGDKAYDLGLKLSEWKLNFDAKNFDWLYCLYTPWKDFAFSYTAKSQEKLADGRPAPDAVYNFVSLGWGEKEDFLESTITFGGTLPRAPMACDDNQVELVRSAVKAGAKYNILLSHFTFACYDRDTAFADDKAHVSTKAVSTEESDAEAPSYFSLFDNGKKAVKKTYYDIGSFYNNRKAMYGLLDGAVSLYKDNMGLIPGKIHYSLSGHAHRAGAYNLKSLGGDEFKVTAMLYSDPGQPDSLDLRELGGGSARCLVCGAAGPYSYKNLKGELGGFGMARPQGMILDVPNDRVEWKEAAAAKPRLAVIMEYLWYVGDCPPFEAGENGGVIYRVGETFYMPLTGQFKALFPDEFQQHPFDCVKLIAVGTAGNATLAMNPSYKGSKSFFERGDFELRLNPGDLQEFKDGLKDCGTILGHFLSITFTEVPGVVRKDDYDLTSPWCFPVDITGDYLSIARPTGTKGGEVPDWVWYGNTWGKEYDPKQANQ